VIDLSRAGAIERPDGEGRAGGGRCDDRVRFTLRLDGDRIAAIRFGADACPAATAAAAWLAEVTEGAGLLDAARRSTAEAIVGARLSERARVCVDTVLDAFHAALGDAVVRGARIAPDANRSVIAMSGGVDSAVVLSEAVDEGRDAVGVTLHLWIDPEAPAPERACCAPAAVRAARDLCHSRGMPHLGLDLRAAFRAAVVDPFVAGYAAGETPNPCTTCNGGFRFDALDDVATRLGAGDWRTGHYARVVEVDGVPLPARGADERKDQSYMLALVDPEILRRVRFPLGDRRKTDTRRIAQNRGLAAADVPESQEVCFLGGGPLAPFLERHGVAMEPGPIVDDEGRELGRHAGARAYTPGQRRGLGVSRGTEALHVLEVDARANTVVVAPAGRLGRREIRLRDLRLHTEDHAVEACLRMRAEPIPGRLEPDDDGGALLCLERPALQVAPGQVAALYRGDVVVGVGVIDG
jgi:tRNA-specific 2-thiouridylase